MVNVTIYSIHGSYGKWHPPSCYQLAVNRFSGAPNASLGSALDVASVTAQGLKGLGWTMGYGMECLACGMSNVFVCVYNHNIDPGKPAAEVSQT